MWRRHGFAAQRDLLQVAHQAATERLIAAGATRLLVYPGVTATQRGDLLFALCRSKRKPKYAWLQTKAELAVAVPPEFEEFVLQKLGEPASACAVTADELGLVLKTAPVGRVGGLLRGRWGVQPVNLKAVVGGVVARAIRDRAMAPGTTLYASTTSGTPWNIPAVSLRPSEFETDARDLGPRTREQWQQDGYRFWTPIDSELGNFDDTRSHIDGGASTVVPWKKEAPVTVNFSEDQLAERIADKVADRLKPFLAEQFQQLRADYMAKRLDGEEYVRRYRQLRQVSQRIQ